MSTTNSRSRKLLVVIPVLLLFACIPDATGPIRSATKALRDITVPLDAGNLVVNAIYNGSDFSTFGTDGCPFGVTAQMGTNSVSSGPCVGQGPFQLTNLAPGSYGVSLKWGQSFGSSLTGPDAVTITAGAVTTKTVDVTNKVGIVTGIMTVNGVPVTNATLCVRSPLDASGQPSMNAGSVCKGFNPVSPGGPANDGRFKFFVPAGAARGDVTGFGGSVLKQFSFVVVAGQTLDLGTIDAQIGDLRVSPIYNGQEYGSYLTDGCPFGVTAQSGAFSISNGPCLSQNPFQLTNLVPGDYSVSLKWGLSSSAAVFTGTATVTQGGVTDVRPDISTKVGIVTGILMVNGQPASNATLCVRSPLDGTGQPLMNSGSLCKGFNPVLPGGPPNDGRFKFFVPAGAAKADVTGFGGGVLTNFSFTAVAGQTLDLGTISAGVGDLRISATYNGQDYSTYLTDGCPFGARAQSATASVSSGPCLNQNPIQLSNLTPGDYSVSMQWGLSFGGFITQTATVVGGAVTPVSFNITDRVAIITGVVTINGAPPNNVTLCVRTPLDASGVPLMNAGSLCKFFSNGPPMPGAPPNDGRFKFFVPKGCGKGSVNGTGGSLVGEFTYCADAGSTVDVGDPLGNRPPTITNTGGPYSGAEGSAIHFTASATDPDNDALTYQWSFGDGAVGTGASATHVYDDNGTYTATLAVKDAKDASAIATASVVVTNVPPSATLSVPVSVAEGTSFTVSLSSATDVSAADRAHGFDYSFDCGGSSGGTFGAWSSLASVVCAAGHAESQTVRARVRDKDGGIHDYSATLTVTKVNRPPTITSTGGPYSGAEGAAIHFTASATDPDNDALTYQWSFGDGAVGTGAGATHVYDDNGTYTATLTVKDAKDATATATASVAVTNVPPSATLSVPVSVTEGTSFTGSLSSATDVSAADRAHGFEYSFDCGGSGGGTFGAWSSLASVVCATSDNESRAVRARVRDKDGGIQDYTATLTVSNVAPIVSIAASPAPLIQSELFAGQGSFSDPGADTWTATVSYDGVSVSSLTLTGKSFALSHQYRVSGTFVVTVRVRDDDGGEGAQTVAVRVWSFADAVADARDYTRLHLGAEEIQPLLASLDAASASLARGNTTSATNQLEAYLNKLSAFVGSGRVSAEDGAVLSAKIRRILSAMTT